MKIEVLYKDYGKFDGELHLVNEQYECWKEEGNYTYLYEKYDDGNGAPTLILPTHAVCWIKPISA